MTPKDFVEELHTKSFTDGKEDWPMLGELARAGFAEGMAKVAEVLNYNGVELQLGWGDEEAKLVAEAIGMGAMADHTVLNLFKNEIGDEGMKALSSAIASGSVSNLRELRLYGNNIGDEGIKVLAEALKSLKKLHTLTLDYNAIGDKGAIALADAIPKMRSLKSMELSNNAIGDEGAKALATAVQKHARMRQLACEDGGFSMSRLDISKNKIGDVGAKAFQEMLEADMRKVGPGGQSLSVMGALSDFKLSENAISDEGKAALNALNKKGLTV